MFLQVVAEGRKSHGITVDRANELGRGHVWTGSQAFGLGLVDHRGGVAEALDRAAELAHVGSPLDSASELVVLPRPPSGLLQRAIDLATEVREPGVREQPPLSPSDLAARVLVGPSGRAPLRLVAPMLAGPGTGVEARIPFDIEIR
jgi:ClpP class serine protease